MNYAVPRSGASDFDGVGLGDRRLHRRLFKVVSALEEQPDASFPKIFATGAALEGFYRTGQR